MQKLSKELIKQLIYEALNEDKDKHKLSKKTIKDIVLQEVSAARGDNS